MLTYASILSWLLIVPLLGGFIVLSLRPSQAKKARPVALTFTFLTFLLAVLAAGWFDWSRFSYTLSPDAVQLVCRLDWIPSLGTQYDVGVDGLSLPFVLLTTVIFLLACWASYAITPPAKGYFALLLFLLSAVIGVFISLDLLLFFVFFELCLVPLYFLIGIWGGPHKEYAALKFFLFSLVGSIAFLIAVLGIYYHTLGENPAGGAVFDLIRLATDPLLKAKFAAGGAAAPFATAAFWLLFVGFAVRIPVVPLHTWLPDLHLEAPTAVSMILAGTLLPTGAYGLVRILYPIFSSQAADNWFWLALIAVFSMIYAALVAMAQKDLKSLIVYASISSMAWVVLGLSVVEPTAAAGAIFQMFSHGICFALLFFVAGIIFDRAHHRDIARLGGLWAQMPAYTGWAVIAFLAAMGLPGLCGFIGELLVLLGAFSAANADGFLARHAYTALGVATPLLWFAVIAAASTILTAGYLLWTVQRVYMGAAKPEYHNFARLSSSERWILAILGLAAIALGVLPMLLLSPLRPALQGFMRLLTG